MQGQGKLQIYRNNRWEKRRPSQLPLNDSPAGDDGRRSMRKGGAISLPPSVRPPAGLSAPDSHRRLPNFIVGNSLDAKLMSDLLSFRNGPIIPRMGEKNRAILKADHT